MANIVTHLGSNFPWIAYRNGQNTFTVTFTQSSVAFNISSYTFVCSIRKIGDSSNQLQLTQSTGITNGGATGLLTIDLTAANISASLPASEYFYEITYTVSSKSYALIQGILQLASQENPGSTTTSVSLSVSMAGTNVSAAVTLANPITPSDIITALGYIPEPELGYTPEDAANKDTASGYVGLNAWKINFRNLANTVTSFLQNSATAVRAYTFPDKDITIVGTVDIIGVQDLYIPAVAMWARTTSGCAAIAKTEITTSLVNIQTLDFDQTTQEFAQFTISLPRNWNNGTVTAKFYWTAGSGSGTVQWGISGGAYSNDDALSTALGTAITVDDTLITANDLHTTDATSAITLAGNPADADFLAFQISRNPANDSLNADAKLLGVVITLTTDAGIAA